jgi:hypothetical protein
MPGRSVNILIWRLGDLVDGRFWQSDKSERLCNKLHKPEHSNFNIPQRKNFGTPKFPPYSPFSRVAQFLRFGLR